jgi:hypothetical protein
MTVIRSDDGRLPGEVAKEIGALVSQLQAVGWTVSFAQYDPKMFGGWYVDLGRADQTIRLTKDRSQYILSGPSIKELQAAGLWKAFDDLDEFCRAAIHWATERIQSIRENSAFGAR